MPRQWRVEVNSGRGAGAHGNLGRREPGQASAERSFYIGASFFCALVGFWPVLHSRAPRIWWLAAGVALLLSAAFRPALLQPVVRLWRRGGLLFSRVGNPIAAGVLLYGVFAPVGLMQRMLGRDALGLRFNAKAQTYWIEHRPPGPSPRTASLLVEVVAFLKLRKKLWLLPLVILMMALGILLVLAQGTAPSPFIYPLY